MPNFLLSLSKTIAVAALEALLNHFGKNPASKTNGTSKGP